MKFLVIIFLLFRRQQNNLKSKCRLEDCEEWQTFLNNSIHQLCYQRDKITFLKFKKKFKFKGSIKLPENTTHTDNIDCNDKKLPYIIGLDISFIKDNTEDACVGLTVLSLPYLEVVYEETTMIKITVPYVSGYLAFREAEFYVGRMRSFMEAHPDFRPLCLMVDGNGVLHKKNFGLACHIGVMLDLPTIGVAKKLSNVDGIEKNNSLRKKIENMQNCGDSIMLESSSGNVLGIALRSGVDSRNPVYISVGHKISLQTAINLVKLCCVCRIPEPIRLVRFK
ncbi:hypothetical protein HELRODRAFT_85315 [Helobdella robusta]|uniref:Endonuclease V n=1 Tax=Helobdella robusta TaxID=6412 RepID=T1G5V3_HELRO|nr:hypothetical protein HELRODRAFT_85315 [Helobdella robusta]ESN97619.1 hypothetical protein HELRODRAFT_85315 [Helobdella robusta]